MTNTSIKSSHVISMRLYIIYLHFFTHTRLQESNYFTPQGEFRVDAGGAPTLLNCLMYKLAYHRFGEVHVSMVVMVTTSLM